jgi:transposase
MLTNLKLPNWRVLGIEESDREHRIHAEYVPQPAHCPHCGSSSDHVRFGKRTQRFRDVPAQGKPVSLLVRRRRYLCKDCGKTFLELLPDMDGHHRATKRLVAYIRREVHSRSFVSIAAEVGMSEGSIRNIQREQPTHAATGIAVELGATNGGTS